MKMHRRDFIKKTVVTSTLLSTGVLAGCTPAKSVSEWFEQSIKRLKSLQQQRLTFTGPWQAFATFSHLAESIEFSLAGFPQQKSTSFKTWVGKPAFSLFKAIGKMKHNTAEPIPGAKPLDYTNTDPEAINAAIARVIDALLAFQNSTVFYPHFAYGDLSHDDYLIAHLLHIDDHLALLTTDV